MPKGATVASIGFMKNMVSRVRINTKSLYRPYNKVHPTGCWTISWNSTGEIGRIGRHRAEKPNVEVTVGLGPMPSDASDFPGGIPAVRYVVHCATKRKSLAPNWAFLFLS